MFSRLKSNQFRLATSILVAVICVLLIWYPFGFSLGGMIEEWEFIHLFERLPEAWNAFPGRPMAAGQSARPLQPTVFYLAYLIDPHSFLGFHLLLIASCLCRVIAGCSIGFWIFRERGYAAIFGALLLVFPADTQQISLRTMNISIASTMMLIGAALMLMALTRKRSLGRVILAGASTIISCVATLIYEPVIVLYALPPLLVLIRLGVRGALSFVFRRFLVWVIWCAGPLVNAAYLWYAVVVLRSKYQTDLIHDGSGLLGDVHYLLSSAAYRIFFDGWRSCWIILTEEVGNRWLFAMVAVALAGFFTALVERKVRREKVTYLLRVMLFGAFICVAAYVPYMVSEAHMLTNQRTFIIAAAGASALFVAGIALVFRRNPKIGAAVGSLLVFAGLVAQLYQHDQYARLYTGAIRPYMANVADRVDLAKPVHLIVDHSGFGGYLHGMYFSKISDGPAARLGDRRGAYFLCMDEPFSAAKFFYHCELAASGWTVSDMNGSQWKFSKSDVDVVAMDHHFDAHYRARSLIWKDLGSFSGDDSLFNREHSPDSYHCRADSGWGYLRFCRGEGWVDGIPSTTIDRQSSFASIAGKSNLLFGLVPTSEAYELRIALLKRLSRLTQSSLKIEINGTRLDVSAAGKTLSAVVQQALLVSGLNEIAISNAGGPNPASISVTAVDLAPQSKLPDPPRDDSPEMPADRWLSASSDEGYALLGEGFSGPEAPRGVWTDGEIAVVRFRAPNERDIDYLDLEVVPYLDVIHPSLEADVVVNQDRPIHLCFGLPAKGNVITVPIHADKNGGAAGIVEVTISIKDPRRPQSNDPRYLGLFLRRLRVR